MNEIAKIVGTYVPMLLLIAVLGYYIKAQLITIWELNYALNDEKKLEKIIPASQKFRASMHGLLMVLFKSPVVLIFSVCAMMIFSLIADLRVAIGYGLILFGVFHTLLPKFKVFLRKQVPDSQVSTVDSVAQRK